MAVFLAEPVADVIAVTTTLILFVWQFKKALQELTTLALTGLTEPQTIYISHGDCHEDACYVAKQMEKSEFVKKIIMQPLDPVSACHTGPNSIGIFFV